jgi:hypothetical protein
MANKDAIVDLPQAHFEGGATRSEHKPWFELVPRLGFAVIVRAVAKRMTGGAKKHGYRNWEQGGRDFYEETRRHLFDHFIGWWTGDKSDDHFDALLTNFFMVADMEARGVHKLPWTNPPKGIQ